MKINLKNELLWQPFQPIYPALKSYLIPNCWNGFRCSMVYWCAHRQSLFRHRPHLRSRSQNIEWTIFSSLQNGLTISNENVFINDQNVFGMCAKVSIASRQTCRICAFKCHSGMQRSEWIDIAKGLVVHGINNFLYMGILGVTGFLQW